MMDIHSAMRSTGSWDRQRENCCVVYQHTFHKGNAIGEQQLKGAEVAGILYWVRVATTLLVGWCNCWCNPKLQNDTSSLCLADASANYECIHQLMLTGSLLTTSSSQVVMTYGLCQLTYLTIDWEIFLTTNYSHVILSSCKVNIF